MPGESGVVDPQQFGIVGGPGVGPDPQAVRHRGFGQVLEGPAHLQEFADHRQVQGVGHGPRRGLGAVRPEPDVVPLPGGRGPQQRGADAAAAGAWMDDQFPHRIGAAAARGQVEVTEDVAALGGEQMPGALVGKFAKHLLPDRRDTIGLRRRLDQFTNPALLFRGERGLPGRLDH